MFRVQDQGRYARPILALKGLTACRQFREQLHRAHLCNARYAD